MRRQTSKVLPRPTTLRVSGASEIPHVLSQLGVDPRDVLATVDLSLDVFDKPDRLMTYATRDRLMDLSVARTGCRHFGLLVGQRMTLPSLGLVGYLMATAPDCGTALRELVRYLPVHSPAAVMSLEVDGDLAVLTYDTFQPDLVAADQTGDGAVAMMLNAMRTLCGPHFQPVEVAFAHRKPKDIGPFRQFFRVPMYFDATRFALLFSADWLAVRPPGADAELHRLLQKQIDELGMHQNLNFPEQVKGALHSALLTGQFREDQIAALFEMPTRTLSRRLETFGTGYRAILDECRFEIARQVLRNTSLSIAEIAVSLGYTRASTFIRAFRRWSGTSPAQWRATHVDDV